MAADIPENDNTIDEVTERLMARFPAIAPEKVREVVTEAYRALEDAHVRDFVAVLVEKDAKKVLKHL